MLGWNAARISGTWTIKSTENALPFTFRLGLFLNCLKMGIGLGRIFPRAEITRGVCTAGIAARSLKSPPSSAISWRNESSVKEIGLTSDELAGLPALGVLTLEAELNALDAELLGIPCGGITGLGESI